MKMKIAAFAAALMASLGMIAVAAPVNAAAPQVCHTALAADNTVESQTCVPASVKKAELARWGYCNPTYYNNRFYLYNDQGYCGSSVSWGTPAGGSCTTIPDAWKDWAASGINTTVYDIIVYDGTACQDVPNSAGWIPYDSSHPNFYAMNNGINIGNKVSSFYAIDF
jgi:hypothetical protein